MRWAAQCPQHDLRALSRHVLSTIMVMQAWWCMRLDFIVHQALLLALPHMCLMNNVDCPQCMLLAAEEPCFGHACMKRVDVIVCKTNGGIQTGACKGFRCCYNALSRTRDNRADQAAQVYAQQQNSCILSLAPASRGPYNRAMTSGMQQYASGAALPDFVYALLPAAGCSPLLPAFLCRLPDHLQLHLRMCEQEAGQQLSHRLCTAVCSIAGSLSNAAEHASCPRERHLREPPLFCHTPLIRSPALLQRLSALPANWPHPVQTPAT